MPVNSPIPSSFLLLSWLASPVILRCVSLILTCNGHVMNRGCWGTARANQNGHRPWCFWHLVTNYQHERRCGDAPKHLQLRCFVSHINLETGVIDRRGSGSRASQRSGVGVCAVSGYDNYVPLFLQCVVNAMYRSRTTSVRLYCFFLGEALGCVE